MSINPVQTLTHSLIGNGAVAGATSVTLQSFLSVDGTPLAMSDFGTKGYGTIEPNTSNEDSITFTGIVQNANGTATLTGVTSVGFEYPFTEVGSLRTSHAGAVPFIVSNTSAFYSNYANKNNQETILQNWSVPDPVNNTDIANRQWVLSVINGGPVSVDAITIAGNAGETVSAGDFLYLNSADNEWYKSDADTAYGGNQQFGVAQGSGTNGNTISGGILVRGLDSNQSSLISGTSYFLSGTAGDITASKPSNVYFAGVAVSTTEILVNFALGVQVSAGSANAGDVVKLNGSGKIDDSMYLPLSPSVQAYYFVDMDNTAQAVSGTTETTVYTRVLPSDFWTTSSGLKITMSTDAQEVSSGGGARTFRVKLGGTTVVSIATGTINQSTDITMFTTAYIVNNASLSSQKWSASLVGTSNSSSSSTLVGNIASVYAVGTSSINTTSGGTLTVTLQQGDNDPGDATTLRSIIVERIG